MFQAPQFFWRALPIKPWLGEDFWAPRRSFVRVSRSKGGFCPSVAFCAKWTETIAVKGISLRILSWNPDLSNTCFSEKDIKQIGSKRNEIDQRNTSMNQYVQKKCVCVCVHMCGYIVAIICIRIQRTPIGLIFDLGGLEDWMHQYLMKKSLHDYSFKTFHQQYSDCM